MINALYEMYIYFPVCTYTANFVKYFLYVLILYVFIMHIYMRNNNRVKKSCFTAMTTLTYAILLPNDISRLISRSWSVRERWRAWKLSRG